MKLTTKQQAADQGTHGPILLAAWEAGETRVTVGGKEYELVREAEPVVMYTGHELIAELSKAFPEHATAIASLANVFIDATSLILARRAEMLRALGDEELVEQVAQTIAGLGPLSEFAQAAIALVREHIEANRPVLTDEVKELRAENERLKGELSRWRTEHACCGSVDELYKKQDEINKLADLLSRARADQLEKSKELNARLARIKELEAAHSPQPVDDSDEYGILVQDGCVALVRRLSRGWATEYYISGSNVVIDPARVFKVTSQPRGPLKVPSKEDIAEKAVSESSIVERNRWFGEGALWAIDWIKKENGAE